VEARRQALGRRLRAGQSHAPAVRRVEMPKGTGTTRPLGIPTVEERRRQRAVARSGRALYEQDCRACSCGYRPGRQPPRALQALRDHRGTGQGRPGAEADIPGYCTHRNHEWRRKMIARRRAAPGITGVSGKGRNAGVMEHGVSARPEAGTPHGGPLSPCLANVYLHSGRDLWCAKRAQKDRQGEASRTRVVDDCGGALQ